MRVAVIGSGHAGLSCAKALLRRGLAVTIIDGGERLSEPTERVRQTLAGMPRDQWPTDLVAAIRRNPTVTGAGLPKKLYFGEDFIYAADRPFAPTELRMSGRSLTPTYARGGYSVVWGGAALPAAECDIGNWPITRSDLAPYFEKVLADIPLTGNDGTLAEDFPRYKLHAGSLTPGPQGRTLLADLERAGDRLKRADTLFGSARLMVRGDDEDHPARCTQCGLCFAGCPQGAIYSTLPELERLIAEGRINYRPGLIVRTLSDDGREAVVRVIDSATQEECEMRFQAAFLAAGPINSTRILLQSKALYDREVILKESQKFVIPTLRLTDAPGALDATGATLSAAFVEAKDRSISDHWIHVQMTPINDMILEALGFAADESRSLKRTLAGPLLRRLVLAWCGMHSDHSSSVVLKLMEGSGGNADVLQIDTRISKEGRKLAYRFARTLFRRALGFRSLVLFPIIKFSNPGSGTHCGGAFPMRHERLAPFDSDIYGRPFDWSRIFVIDSTVLPSIPGTTLALNVMANAYRIGDQAPLTEEG